MAIVGLAAGVVFAARCRLAHLAGVLAPVLLLTQHADHDDEHDHDEHHAGDGHAQDDLLV